MSLVENLQNAVSDKYKKRVLELARVLDPKVSYKIERVTKTIKFKEALNRTLAVKEGYTTMTSDLFVLNGILSLYPDVVVKGDLVVALLINRAVNRETKEIVKEDTILILEHTVPNLKSFYLQGGAR